MKLFGTDDVMNVLTYRVDINTTVDDAAFMVEAAARLDVNYGGLLADISTLLTFETIDGQNISKSELLPEVPWPVITAGTNVNALLPTQVAAEVFWPTITPKVRTSSFLGGYAVTANSPTGEVQVATIARINTFAIAQMTLINTNISLVKGSFNPLLLLFTASGLPVVPNRWRTQRRRRVGVGS
jgi:hypothetical protein